MGRVESGPQDRILKLLARHDRVEPAVEKVEVVGKPQHLVDVDAKFQPVPRPEVLERKPKFLAAVDNLRRDADLVAVGGVDADDPKAVIPVAAAAPRRGVKDPVPDRDPVAILVQVQHQLAEFGIGRAAGEREDEMVSPRIAPRVLVALQMVRLQVDDAHPDRVGGHQDARLQTLGDQRPATFPFPFSDHARHLPVPSLFPRIRRPTGRHRSSLGSPSAIRCWLLSGSTGHRRTVASYPPENSQPWLTANDVTEPTCPSNV